MLLDWLFLRVEWVAVATFVKALAIQAGWLMLVVLGTTIFMGLVGRFGFFEGEVKMTGKVGGPYPTLTPPTTAQR